jgi:hypothetical protein
VSLIDIPKSISDTNHPVYSASSSVTNQIWYPNHDALCKFFPIASPILLLDLFELNWHS